MNGLKHKFNENICFNPKYAGFSILLNIEPEERIVSPTPTIVDW
jgi:hypothetical protein